MADRGGTIEQMSQSTSSDSAQRVDVYIQRYIEHAVTRAESMHPSYTLLWREIERVVASGGKRVRPRLTMLAYGADDEAILPIAAAQELVHVAVLMHDDIIDRDVVRRGQPTINGIYESHYDGLLSGTTKTHYANSAAMLAGDVLLSEAHAMVAGSTLPPETRQRVSGRLAQSVFDVIGGELLDVEAGFLPEPIDPLAIYQHKTASYSFVGPMLCGAYSAGLSEDICDLLESIGEHLGIGFQIQDDILGIYGDQTKTGKSTDTDIREGKRTLLIQEHLKRIDDEKRQRFEAHFGNESASDTQIAQLKHDIEASGAKQIVSKRAETEIATALELIEQLPEPQRSGIRQLASQLVGRTV